MTLFTEQPIRFDDLNIKVRLGALEANVLYIRYEPGCPGDFNAFHCHSGYELHFITRGRGEVRFDSGKLAVHGGIFYLTGPGIFHEQTSGREDPVSELCLSFDLKHRSGSRRQCAGDNPDGEGIFEILSRNRFCFGKDEGSNAELIRCAIRELSESRIGYHPCVQSMLTQVIINLARYFSGDRSSCYIIPEKMLDDKRTLVIDRHFADMTQEPHTPAVLAALLGVSTRQLRRILKKDYAMTYQEKLVHSRLEWAKNLLLTTADSVEEVAAGAGFSSTSYFTRVFKKAEGVSPGQYRKRCSLSHKVSTAAKQINTDSNFRR